jgi:teichuronic acid biosynthesis glycosyltransferase TuaC
MRVALVATSWPSSEHDPAGHFVRAHARALATQGHKVTVVAPSPGGAFGWPGVMARLAERPDRAGELTCWMARTRRGVAALDVDLVVAHWAIPSGWPVAGEARCPVDLVSHGEDVRWLGRLPSPVRAWVTSRLLSHARTWTFASSQLLAELLAGAASCLRPRIERIATVSAPPLELPNVAGLAADLRRRIGRRRIAVAIGRLVSAKQFDLAIEHVARSADFDSLVIVGDGPEQGRLARFAARLDVDARFVGRLGRPQTLAWIAAADALLHASRAEGLSSVIREAEELGTRVIRLGGAA